MAIKKKKLSQEVLRPVSKVCSQNISDWRYLSLEYLEQDEIFPKCLSWGLLVYSLITAVCSRDMPRGQKFKFEKEISELVAN